MEEAGAPIINSRISNAKRAVSPTSFIILFYVARLALHFVIGYYDPLWPAGIKEVL